jgi:hypothetical protein
VKRHGLEDLLVLRTGWRHLTGAAIPVSRGTTALQVAPAAALGVRPGQLPYWLIHLGSRGLRSVCHYALAVMATAGLYETSGDWLYDIGLPGKSGIGGGIVTVSPGKGGLGAFAPPLDQAGNSVKGQLVARFLSQRLGMGLFVSKPEA